MRILLVEDESAHVELVRRAFARAGDEVEIVIASTTEQARLKLASMKPDLVIADLVLPDGLGSELIDKGPQSVPVVLFTGHGDEEAAVEAMRAGALDYVVKSESTIRRVPHIARRAIREWQHVVACERAVEAERVAQARCESILGAIPDMVAEMDGQGRIIWLNRAGRDYFGDGAVGKHLVEFASSQDAQQHVPPKGPSEHFSAELWQRRQDGTSHLLSWTGRAHWEDGKLIGAWCTARDVTVQRSLEQKLRNAQRLEAIGKLASGVAHDFNNLLMGICGCADMALSRLKPTDSAWELVELSKMEALKGAALTRQLLHYARPTSVKPDLIDLNAAVAQSETLLGRLLGEDIRLDVQLHADDGRLWANPGQLDQVLMNLVVNARDAMPEGGALDVSTGEVRVDDGGDGETQLVLTVRDSGIGMDEETQTRAFDTFFTTKPAGEGTGLGLATVRDIVEQHGGTCALTSAPGYGTTVTITLPRGDVPRTSPDDTGEYPASLRGNETVLVVDDEPLVRLTVVHYLQRWGYRVLEAGTGREALRICQEHTAPIDVLLADVVLPDVSGPDIARQATAERPIACVFMSAHPREKLRRERRLPRDAIALEKPFVEEELLGKVRIALAQRTPTQSAVRKVRARVLVAEDHAVARKSMCMLLEGSGFSVLSAADGNEAARLCAKGRIDILITDVRLPGLNGVALIEHARALNDLRGVIAISGAAVTDPEIEPLLAEPNVSFLNKPVDYETLEAEVFRLLSAPPSRRNPRESEAG